MSRTAAEWLVREQSDALTPAERREFQAWLEASPDNERAYQNALRMWNLSAELAEDPAIQEELSLLRQQQVRKHLTKRSIVRALLYAGGALGGLAAALALWMSWPQTQWHTTLVGQNEEIALPDGSTLSLGTHSRVGTRFSPWRRQLILERGEIVVDVAHSTLRSFVVQAGPGSVRALGTRFDIVFEEGVVTVTLLQGRVQVQTSSGSQRRIAYLSQGEALAYAADGSLQRPDSRLASAERIEGWQSGTWPFDGWTIEEAVREHNRYAQRPVVLRIGDLRRERITGRFRIGETAEFVAAVSVAIDGTAIEQHDAILLVQREATASGVPPR